MIRLTCLFALALSGLALPDRAFTAEPAGLPPIPFPQDNPPTDEKIALGKQLYFDGRLSADNKVSCASCHDPAKGFSNGDQFATGVEMNLTLEAVVAKLNGIPGYQSQFQKVFGTDVTSEGIAKAIAAYERTILSGDAPYDQFKAGNAAALSEAAQRGMKLFFGKANCIACHSGPNFTDNGFHNIGIPGGDEGRFAVTKSEGDKGAFKTPTVREIAKTGPYMHDGSLKTLEEVVAHYIKGGTPNPQLDEDIFPLKLSPEEAADLVTFLKDGLSSASYPNQTAPELPQ